MVAVAVWVLLRPSRVQAMVATLRFWNAATADTQQGTKQRFARVRLSWLVLLLGALGLFLDWKRRHTVSLTAKGDDLPSGSVSRGEAR